MSLSPPLLTQDPGHAPPRSTASPHATLRLDRGKGRVVCLIHEWGAYAEFVERVATALDGRARLLWIETAPVTATSWHEIVQAVRGVLAECSVRQASIVGLGAASTVLQSLCLEEVRLVRTAIFVDAATRAHPSRAMRVVDWLEEHLPLGLPLRLRQAGFDGKPFLQRIRCPSLVVTTSRADGFLLAQAEMLAHRLPTAWRQAFEGDREVERFVEAVLEFYDVPAKCPQKNLA